MPNMNIYIPDDLKARMDARAESPKWSKIAQRAFELELASTQKGDLDMEAVVERLRASREKSEQQQRPDWAEAGRKWAAEDAEYDELARVGDIPIENYLDDEEEVRKVLNVLCAAITDDPQPDQQQLRELCEMLTGNERKQPTLNQLAWFIEGAQGVWEEVGEKI